MSEFVPTGALIASRCQSCASHDPTWVPAFEQLSIARCSSCGSLSFYGNPKVPLSSLYGEAYFQGAEYFDYLGHIKIHEKNFARKWRILAPFLPSPLRLFEIGCCYGYFISYALKHGTENAFGVDISESAIAYARDKFGPYFESAAEVRFPPFEYNCAVAWDVWEHLEAPLDYFEAVAKNLAAGGIVALTTVDAGALVARIRGPRWRQIHPPTHLHYPTRRALRRAFEALGFEILYHRSFGYHRALECYLRALGGSWAGCLPEKIRTLPLLVDVKDTQFLIARKQR